MHDLDRARREKGWRVLGHLALSLWGLSLAVCAGGVLLVGVHTCEMPDLSGSKLMDRVHIHALRRGALPATLGEVVQPVPLDRYGRPWAYRRVGATSFELRSRGPDGRAFTDDDVVLAE